MARLRQRIALHAVQRAAQPSLSKPSPSPPSPKPSAMARCRQMIVYARGSRRNPASLKGQRPQPRSRWRTARRAQPMCVLAAAVWIVSNLSCCAAIWRSGCRHKEGNPPLPTRPCKACASVTARPGPPCVHANEQLPSIASTIAELPCRTTAHNRHHPRHATMWTPCIASGHAWRAGGQGWGRMPRKTRRRELAMVMRVTKRANHFALDHGDQGNCAGARGAGRARPWAAGDVAPAVAPPR